MTVAALIERLQALQSKHGNVEVQLYVTTQYGPDAYGQREMDVVYNSHHNMLRLEAEEE